MRSFKMVITAMVAATALLLPSTASAVTPVVDQYGNPVAGVGEGPTAGAGEAPVAGAGEGPAAGAGEAGAAPTAVAGEAAAPVATLGTTGMLPFTGAELVALMLAGVALLGSGALLKRVGFARSAKRSRVTSR